MTQEEIDNLKKENETLKLLLWDYFKISQGFIMEATDKKERDQWYKFLYDNGNKIPFHEDSTACKVVRICDKEPKNAKWL